MARGTSPGPRRNASTLWTGVAWGIGWIITALQRLIPKFRCDLPWLARTAAGLHLGAVGLLMITAWDHPMGSEAGKITGTVGLHLAFLITTGAAAAFLALVGTTRANQPQPAPAPNSMGAIELMAQMSHELRTPLNAVIGFSEAMRRELHGPLGNSRYQEYAHHISESGSRLLKSSEDALAVAHAMTTLVADRAYGKAERLIAGRLVRQAWRDASAGGKRVRLAVSACDLCDIVCDQRAVVAALEHLLREAVAHAATGATVQVAGGRHGGRRTIVIHVTRANHAVSGAQNLRVILARLLLQSQNASLRCEAGGEAGWSAIIEFAPRT